MMLEWLSPLSASLNLGLVLLSALTSGLSAAAGIGGGTLLIMVMAQVMPATALIPVQGLGGPKPYCSCCICLWLGRFRYI
ncbi:MULTISPECIES: hypothetical protein [Halomonas]|uniref:Sulfite exporter TauE/SafE n=1 Tax=Halomonas flagellata TaxID=2920385 RepID=A0ABS9RTD0_9GAMM|nr:MULTISPECIES: hypothetical protein [Halomonas]MCH4563080.1 hypothetical protein [Halomonas flagellata]